MKRRPHHHDATKPGLDRGSWHSIEPNCSDLIGALATSVVLVGLAVGSNAGAQGTASPPRPGLTAQQTKDAIKLAKGAMTELRKKTEGASLPAADVREYVVGVELLVPKETAPPAAEGDAPKTDAPAEKDSDKEKKEKEKEKATPKAKGPRAVVTSYRYFDDITVFSIIDLGTGRVVDVQAVQHLHTPLSDDEFDEAQALAREKSDEVKQLYERFGEQIRVDAQFSQFRVKDDPRTHRVVYLIYRVGKRELSYPRPEVNLTTREVETPAPEPQPKERRRPQ